MTRQLQREISPYIILDDYVLQEENISKEDSEEEEDNFENAEEEEEAEVDSFEADYEGEEDDDSSDEESDSEEEEEGVSIREGSTQVDNSKKEEHNFEELEPNNANQVTTTTTTNDLNVHQQQKEGEEEKKKIKRRSTLTKFTHKLKKMIICGSGIRKDCLLEMQQEQQQQSQQHQHKQQQQEEETIQYTENGTIKLPQQFGNVKVLDFGTLFDDDGTTQRSIFYLGGIICPYGYKIEVEYLSMVNRSSDELVSYTLRLEDRMTKDGQVEPAVMVEEQVTDGYPRHFVVSNSIKTAWNTVVEQANQARYREPPPSHVITSGADFIGFNHPLIIKAIQQLPGADRLVYNMNQNGSAQRTGTTTNSSDGSNEENIWKAIAVGDQL
jgi:hypothetical protein